MRTKGESMWCSHCEEFNEILIECGGKYICCSVCAKVLDSDDCKCLRKISKLKKFQGLRRRAGSVVNIDDLEVAQFLHNEKQTLIRKMIWEEMRKDYLQVQAAKGAGQASLAYDSEESISANELAKLTAASLAKSRKKKNRKHPTDNKSSTSTKSHSHELKLKSFSSKINYEALESLSKDNTEKQGIEESGKECEDAPVNNAENGNGDHCNIEDYNYIHERDDEWVPSHIF